MPAMAQRSRFLRLAAIATGAAPERVVRRRGRDDSPVVVVRGVAAANAVSERVLELSLAAVQLLFAWQLAKKAGLR
jgi:hypothetical protein